MAERLRPMPQHGTIHDSVYNVFSFALFAAYELESEDRENPGYEPTRTGAPGARKNIVRMCVEFGRRQTTKGDDQNNQGEDPCNS